MLKLLREASIEAQRRGLSKTSAGDEHAFFQADLSSPKEIKRVADELKRKADERGIDYLVETQGKESFDSGVMCFLSLTR